MGRLGADPVELRRLATAFERAGEGLEDDARSVATKIRAAGWDGPDAQRYRGEWDATHRPALLSVASAFGDVARLLREEATAQERASGEGTAAEADPLRKVPDGLDLTSRNDTHWRPVDTDGDGEADTWKAYDPNTHQEYKRVDTDGDGKADTLQEVKPGGRHRADQWHDRVTLKVQDESWKGEAHAFAGWQHGDQGEFGDEDGGHGEGSYHVEAGAGANAGAGVSIGKEGVTAEAKAGADFGVGANAEGKLGYGEHLTAKGEAAAHVGGRAEASAGVTAGPGGLSAKVGGEAMVGAEASAAGAFEVSGIGVGGSVHGYAGAGVHASADASFSPDKVGFKLDFGVALGLGAGASVDLSVSPTKVVEGIKDLGGAAADVAGDVGDALTFWD